MHPDHRFGNAFLDNLPYSVRDSIESIASLIHLDLHDVLYEKGAKIELAYFPVTALIANVITMGDGGSIEVRVVGREGMTGLPMLLTNSTSDGNYFAQLSGTAYSVPKGALVEMMGASVELPRLFALYAESIIGSLSQLVACNRLHHIEARFARLLIMAHDRVAGDTIDFTHEFLALMLGVQRPGVTYAAARFRSAGLIAYSRGRIVVRNRPALEAAACECYGVVEDRFEELLGFSIRKKSA
jgi:CRP-like cAMP-binding protein